MRKIWWVIAASGAICGLITGAVMAWRRNPRMGSGFVNDVVNPALLRSGLAGNGPSELGTIEHIGRRTGTRRLTPVHPEPTAKGFRFIVPLGMSSEWARNVLAAGHCRLQFHDIVHDLDEPAMVSPADLSDLPRPVRRLEDFLGFRYLTVHRFASRPGTLSAIGGGVPATPERGEPALSAR